MLDETYKITKSQALKILKSSKVSTMGIDGATNVLSKSISNVIIHTPMRFFVKYLRSDLKRETKPNVLAKIKDSISRVGELIDYSIDSFLSDSCNEMISFRRTLLEEKRFK